MLSLASTYLTVPSAAAYTDASFDAAMSIPLWRLPVLGSSSNFLVISEDVPSTDAATSLIAEVGSTT